MPTEFTGAVKQIIIVNIYIALLSAWVISIQRRIMHRRVRHYLLMTSLSLLLLIVLRIYKQGIFANSDFLNNFTWYCYYIPLLFVGLFSYRTAQSLYLDEGYKLPFKKKNVLGIPTHIFVFFVLTNPIHGLLIGVDDGKYRIGYYVIVAWIFSLIIVSVHKALSFANADKRKKTIIVSMLVASFIWLVAYAINPSTRGFGFIEYVIIVSVIVISLWETLIQLNIVPSNTEYEWCFENSTVKAQIFDDEGKLRYKAGNVETLSGDLLEKLVSEGTVLKDENTELEASQIIGGLVVWERDVSEINALLEELTETRDSIYFATQTLRKDISVESRKHSLMEQNRLYDLIISNTDFQIALIEKYLEMCETADDASFLKMMREISVYGCYIKRKSNLVLVSNEEGADLYKEIQLAIKEIMNNVSKDNVECSYIFTGEMELTIDVCLVMMDLLESVLELSLPLLSTLIVMTGGNTEDIRLTICLTIREEIRISENFFRDCFNRWNRVIADNFIGSLDLESEGNVFTISMSIPIEKGVKA